MQGLLGQRHQWSVFLYRDKNAWFGTTYDVLTTARVRLLRSERKHYSKREPACENVYMRVSFPTTFQLSAQLNVTQQCEAQQTRSVGVEGRGVEELGRKG